MTTLTGQTLDGRYTIQELIGRGGMGTVYAATDAMLQRRVAIKVLRSELTIDPEFVARFHQEAVAAASLHHPGIVTIYDVGEEQGVHYIVMQFLMGTTLHEWLAGRGPMIAADAEPIVTQLGAALDHAHQRGIIHRDLKPSNIMLSPEGQATLMDFGLVRAGEGSGLTHSGIVVGTPEYMAPEQALGDPVDARTDIYAFGIVIYRLLTGKVPFARSTSMATAYAHVHEPPPPLRQIRPEVPRAVERVVLKALAKPPAERYQSAGQLAAEFAQAATGKVPPALRAFLVRSGGAVGAVASTTPTTPPGPSPASPAIGMAMGDASTQMQPPTPTDNRAAVTTPAAARPTMRRPWRLVTAGGGILAVLLFIWVATRPTSAPALPTAIPSAAATDNRLVAPLTLAPTATLSPTATATPSATATRAAPSPTPTPTVTVTPSSTVTLTPSPTATNTVTRRPALPAPTRTPLPPSSTPPPTDTPVPPPSDTPEPPPTDTPEPPTNTPAPEPTNTPAP